MKFQAEIKIMPLSELLDPQGKAVEKGLQNLEIDNITNVRIGKNINLTIEADSEEEAKKVVETASKKLLANPVMESYTIQLKAVK
ncbi:MAG: phosphoribosylformylglycinamidine synthase subunit PurS [Chitinophagaceae bacterium]|nr:MAG: phosphoribosylformylglycinamidine synthase subunit PurS [Chitinophagaceae bacterium]